jgi:hypothetical protein
MSVPQLSLYKEQIPAASKIRQVSVCVPEELNACPLAESCLREDSHDPPVQSGTFVGTAVLVEDQRLTKITGRHLPR